MLERHGAVTFGLQGDRSVTFDWTDDGACLLSMAILKSPPPNTRRQRRSPCSPPARGSRAASSSRVVVPVFAMAR
jgi:hypothetical protein